MKNTAHFILPGLASACLLASAAVTPSLGEDTSATAAMHRAGNTPTPEFSDPRRLPLVGPVRPAERVKREPPATIESGAAAPAPDLKAMDDQRLLAEAEEATQRALEERARAAEVRRRAEELSARFAKDENAEKRTAAHLVPTAATAEDDTEDRKDRVGHTSAKPPVKAASSEQQTKAKRQPSRTAKKKAEKPTRTAQVQPQPAPPPPQEGLLAKMKSNLSYILGW